jgi:uncharacterized cupin superfamily protein
VVLGNEVILKPTNSATSGGYYVFEATTPPGAGVPPHVHQHEDEIIYIIEGEYEVFLDGRTHKASNGAVINFPRFIPPASPILAGGRVGHCLQLSRVRASKSSLMS